MIPREERGPVLNGLPTTLPDVDPEETQEWMDSLDGLLAEAVAASVRTLPDMSQLHRAVQRRSGVNVCLSTLDSPAHDCRTALARALRPFVRASKDAATLATLASRYACRRRGAEPRRRQQLVGPLSAPRKVWATMGRWSNAEIRDFSFYEITQEI